MILQIKKGFRANMNEYKTDLCQVIAGQMVEGVFTKYESSQFHLPFGEGLSREEMIRKLPIGVGRVNPGIDVRLTRDILIKEGDKYIFNHN